MKTADEILEMIKTYLAANPRGRAILSNHLTLCPIRAKHLDMIKAKADGIYTQRGKRWDCWPIGTFKVTFVPR